VLSVRYMGVAVGFGDMLSRSYSLGIVKLIRESGDPHVVGEELD